MWIWCEFYLPRSLTHTASPTKVVCGLVSSLLLNKLNKRSRTITNYIGVV
jgi:hypothetical protein